MRRTLFTATVVALAGLLPASAHSQRATSHPYWYKCTLVSRIDQGTTRKCHEYPLVKETRKPLGYARHCEVWAKHRDTQTCIRFPYFVARQTLYPGLYPRVRAWAPSIFAAANATGIPANIIGAVMETESGGDPSSLSYTGAIGLMQLEPATAAAMGVNLYDPAQNILGGARYLAYLLHGPAAGSLYVALAMYNGGPGNPQYSYAIAVLAKLG